MDGHLREREVRALHASGVEAAAGCLDVTDVPVGPVGQSVDRHPQALARLGEGVLDPRRHGGVHAPVDQAVALQHARVPGEHLVAIATGTKMVVVSGQLSWDADGVTVGEGELAAQVGQSYLNAGTALAAAGASFD